MGAALPGNYPIIQYVNGVTAVSGTTNLTTFTALPRQNALFSLAPDATPGLLDLVIAPANASISNTWSTNGGGSWRNSANWSGGTNIPATQGDVATLTTLSTTGTVTLDSSPQIGTLTFNPSGTGAFTLSAGSAGSVLAFYNTGSTAFLNSQANNNTISAPVALMSPTTSVTVSAGNNLTLSGAIAGSGALTLSAGSMTLSGANTFSGGLNVNSGGNLIFTADNNLGSTTGTVAISGGTLQLNGAGGITLSASRSILIGAGGATINENSAGNLTLPDVIANAGSSAGALYITGAGAGIYVPGNNGAQNTYSGGTHLGPGTTSVINDSSIGSASTGNLVSGPFGTGTLYMDGGSQRPTSGGSYTIGNAVQITADSTFIAGQTNTLTFSGPITLVNGTRTINQQSAGAIIFTGSLTDSGSNYGLVKSGSGTLQLMASDSYTGPTTINAGTLIAGGPASLGSTAVSMTTGTTLGLYGDGDGTDLTNSVAYTNPLTLTGTSATLAVNRAGMGIPYGSALNTTAANKSINLGSSFSFNNFLLTVTNANGYGLNLTGSQTLAGPTTIAVGTNTATYTPGMNEPLPGLTISGQVTGAGAITKTGSGILFLSNASNNFSSGIIVNQGGIAYSADSDLSSGTVTLASPGTGNESSLVALGSFASNVDLKLGPIAAGLLSLRVAAGQTLALNNGFDLSLSTTSSLTKDDAPGNLVLAGNNSAWTGTLTINGGILQVNGLANYANALGTPNSVPTVIAYPGAAFQGLPGQTISKPFILATQALATGMNGGGAIEAVAGSLVVPGMTAWSGTGATTISGSISFTANDAWIGADPGTTLNITGSISGAKNLTLVNAGTINLSTTPLGAINSLVLYTPGVAAAAGLPAGVTTLTTSSGGFVGALTLEAGSLAISGTGQIGATGLITVDAGGTLSVSDTSGAIANRLGGRPLTLNGGTFIYTANGTSPSSETLGAFIPGCGSTLILSNGGPAAATLKMTSMVPANSGNLNIVTTGGTLGSLTNSFSLTTAPTLTPASTGIIPRVTVNGTSFATYSAASGVVPFTGYNNVAGSNLDLSAATDTLSLAVTPTWAQSYTKTLNAITLGSGVAFNGAAGQTLTLTTGNILVPSGNASINGVVTAVGGTEAAMLVNAGATLNMQGPITGTYNVTKALGGTLILSAPVYDTTAIGNWFAVNGGSVQLNAGNQTILPGMSVALTAGATLDLNGNAQMINNLLGGNNAGFLGTGGTLTSSTGTGTLVVSAGSTTFPGQIIGNVNFAKVGANTTTLTNSSNYTGPTTVAGGTVTLQDAGVLAATSGISVNYATLAVNDNGLTGISSRLGAAPITLNGGIFSYAGRTQTASISSAGTLTLGSGNSNITMATGGTGVFSDDLTFAAINLSNKDATLNFTGVDGQTGNNARVLFTNPPAVTNNIVSPQIEYGGTDFASYVPGLGLGALKCAGVPRL